MQFQQTVGIKIISISVLREIFKKILDIMNEMQKRHRAVTLNIYDR